MTREELHHHYKEALEDLAEQLKDGEDLIIRGARGGYEPLFKLFGKNDGLYTGAESIAVALSFRRQAREV